MTASVTDKIVEARFQWCARRDTMLKADVETGLERIVVTDKAGFYQMRPFLPANSRATYTTCKPSAAHIRPTYGPIHQNARRWN